MNMQDENKLKQPETPSKTPDEVGGISLQGHIKIFDPTT